MKITKNNRIQIQGNCIDFPRDTYDIEIREHDMYIGIDNEDYDIITSVSISPEDAIQIAEQILNFYKGGSK